jgi:RNAse (barnase) inhibitor barstar
MTRFVDLSREIRGLRGASIHVLPAGAEAEVRERLQGHGFEIRTLEGSRALGESGFFEEAARALDLPSWFGGNWDAFNDCLSDLMEGETIRIAILWRDAHASLAADVQTVLNAVLAFEATASYPEGREEEPVQMVVFLFGEGVGFGGGERP